MAGQWDVKGHTDWEERCMVGSGFDTHLLASCPIRALEQISLYSWMCWQRSEPRVRPVEPLENKAVWTRQLVMQIFYKGYSWASTQA